MDLIPFDPKPGARHEQLLDALRSAVEAYYAKPTVMTGATLRGAIVMAAERVLEDTRRPMLADALPGAKARAAIDPASCWNRAEDAEPVFILRAKDPLAAPVVRIWASLVNSTQAHEQAKAFQAWEVSNAMHTWRNEAMPGQRQLAVLDVVAVAPGSAA